MAVTPAQASATTNALFSIEPTPPTAPFVPNPMIPPPLPPDVYTTPRGPTLKGYLPGGRAGLDAFSALPGYEQNFIREQGRSPTRSERETGVWDATPQDPFRLPATAPPGQYDFNMPVVPGFNPDGTPIDYMQGGLYQTGLDPEIEARIQQDAMLGLFDVNERSMASTDGFLSNFGNWLGQTGIGQDIKALRTDPVAAIAAVSPEDMNRHRAVTDALAQMTQARRFQTPAGAMATKGPGGYLQLSGQDIGERSRLSNLDLGVLGGMYQGVSEAGKALTGGYANVEGTTPAATALSDAWQNYLGIQRARDPDAPTVQEQAYISPQFQVPGIDYTPATPVRNVARTHLSYENVPVLEAPERGRMARDAQDLVEPLIADRYTGPGSQDIMDMLTQEESFSTIREADQQRMEREAVQERADNRRQADEAAARQEQVRADNQRRAEESREAQDRARENRERQEAQAERAKAIAKRSKAADDRKAAARQQRVADKAAQRERQATIQRQEDSRRRQASERAAKQAEKTRKAAIAAAKPTPVRRRTGGAPASRRVWKQPSRGRGR